MPKTTLNKVKSKLYILTIQDEDGRILKIVNGVEYEHVWLTGTAEAKSMRGYWTIFDLDGRAIDGNFRIKVTK
jgi:hypothetical protein